MPHLSEPGHTHANEGEDQSGGFIQERIDLGPPLSVVLPGDGMKPPDWQEPAEFVRRTSARVAHLLVGKIATYPAFAQDAPSRAASRLVPSS